MSIPARLLSVLLLLIWLPGCGGAPAAPAESASPPPASATTTGQTPAPAAAQPQPVSLPLKTLELKDTRYLDEMVAEETEKAYEGTGEFISPERVAAMLRSTQPAAQPAAKTAQQQETKAPPTWRISGIVNQEASKLFAEGKYAEAAQKWRSLPTDTSSFTISVEIHCSVDTLKQSYAKLQGLEPPVFVLPENVKGRNCYRLCIGVFVRQVDADGWLTQVSSRLPGTYPFALAITRR